MGGLSSDLLPLHISSSSAILQSPDETQTNVWLLVAVAALGSSVISGLVTSFLGNLRSSAADRREGYAIAVRTLIARSEYPYRVRRRVSDAPETLEALVSRGHDLQEQLAACRTWVASENWGVGAEFERALGAIDATAKSSTADAWTQEPIQVAAGMNLEGWGPGDPWPHLTGLDRAIAFRFGWRRLVPTRAWARRK